MFKNTLFIFFFSFASLNLFSQDYIPVIKVGSFWDVQENGSGGCPYYYRYRLADDFVNNTITYRKLEVAPIRGEYDPISLCGPTGNLFVNENDFEAISGKYIREDINEKKVFILVDEDGVYNEYLIANFNLKVGDIFENAYVTDFDTSTDPLKIISISTLSDGRKSYNLNNNQSFEEGLGHIQGPIFSYNYNLGPPYFGVFCFGNSQNQNNCANVLSTERHELYSVKIFPNPVNDILNIENTDNVTLKIFSINGSLLKTLTSNSDLKVNVSSFKSGIYILEISNLKGKKISKILKQ